MSKSKFYDDIKNSLIEREVEDVYNKGINLYFDNAIITHPFACDGFIDTKTENGKILKLIIEYKLDELLKNKIARAKVLIQVIYYLKKFENEGLILPNVCMVGDVNECFVMHTNELLKYLDEDVDWTIAPSNAHTNNAELLKKIAEDEAINPYIFDVDNNFSFKAVADKIKELADDVQRYVRVTEHNIAVIYDYFINNVVKDAKKIQANDLVSIFMGVIRDSENYYQHPSKKNILVTPNAEIAINGDGFKSFFSYFDRNYTPQEKMKFAEISDRLIEDTKRRNTGEFYTPTLFVDYAHRMMEQAFGLEWKDNYVVWDNCCGTKNLTRDYAFADLYCSTLEDGELEIAKNYNKNSVSFKFDFLNDSLDNLPQGLKDALEHNKPIIFLINPPYATACNQGDSSKEGVNDTIVRQQMHEEGLGSGAENIQHQFLYRIAKIKEQYGLTDVHIALYSNPIYMTGKKQKGFLDFYCDNFSLVDGVFFKASHFADVAENWGITFNIWDDTPSEKKNDFVHNLIDNINGEIQVIGRKTLYNVNDGKTASEWVREEIKSKKTDVELPCVCSALKIKESDKAPLSIDDALGYFHNNANSIKYNAQYVGMYSTPFAAAHGVVVMKENYTKCAALFSARKLINNEWYNNIDEYLAPNESSEHYQEFVNDSIVYSLFESKSNQSSLRNVEYKGQKWNIKNEFFFMSKNEMLELANSTSNDECYNDCRTSSDRYVYGLLEGIKLSEEAQKVLDKAREIVRKTFKYRSLFNEEHPEYQINNWDCGWYQIKAVAKEFAKEDYKEFCELYKALADKMRPMVYELGFLK